MEKIFYQGLTEAEVQKSRVENGINRLTPPEKDPLWKQFLEKFTDPLIIILMIAGVLSVGISCYEFFGLDMGGEVFFEPAGIFVAILLATGLAFYFELKADKEFTVLNQVNDEEPVEVVRDGKVTQVPRSEVVVGDIVFLNAGEEVPADAELLEATCMNVDESTLTGEPECRKSEKPEDRDPNATYPTNHVLKGTKIMEGHGVARVLAVGDRTEQGRVYEAVGIDDSVKTPLNEQLDGLSDWITWASYGFAALILIGRVLAYWFNGGFDVFDWVGFTAYLLQTVMIAVTLIVVAVPEGLPMAVTLSLAYSMRRMLKTNNLVRKMHACETMGAATVICTDKTGTLTENRMEVDDVQSWGCDKEMFYEGIAVNSTAFIDARTGQVIGNPTEGATLLWLKQQGVDYLELRKRATITAELPFSTKIKYMAVVAEHDGKRILYVKGAPEIVYDLCQAHDIDSEKFNKLLDEYGRRAMRILGFAQCELTADEQPIVDGTVRAKGLRFVGLASIADPVRKDVPEAVRECMTAGIKVCVVTGDTQGTAMEVGRRIGLWTDQDSERNMITGPEIAAMSDEELLKRAAELKLVSRARPMDKKRLVDALKQLDEVVAVTGDGTNDAPALKAAHVGLSMGSGTSVAKEASDITIINNSFASIGRAVMWGRSLFRNIQRFLLFQLTVNVTACFLVLFGAFMGTESPLTVTQMLWINLIMDTFAAMALASLPPTERVMSEKPRNRRSFILNGSMMREIIGVGGFFFLLLLGLLYIFQHAEINSLTDLIGIQLGARGHVSPYELTLLFTIFVMTHFFYLFVARAYETDRSALHFQGCKGLLTIAAIVFFGTVAMVEIPGLQQFFNVVGLKPLDWAIIIVGSSMVLWVREIWHLIKKACRK